MVGVERRLLGIVIVNMRLGNLLRHIDLVVACAVVHVDEATAHISGEVTLLTELPGPVLRTDTLAQLCLKDAMSTFVLTDGAFIAGLSHPIVCARAGAILTVKRPMKAVRLGLCAIVAKIP